QRVDLFDKRVWAKLNMLVLVQPDGDVVPVRARFNPQGRHTIGVNPLHCETPLWMPLADCVASALRTGRAPQILRAIQLLSRGRATGLRPISVRGARPISPAREDLFKALVEERRRLERLGDQESARTAAALKTVANSAGYGIYAELNRQPARKEHTPVEMFGL